MRCSYTNFKNASLWALGRLFVNNIDMLVCNLWHSVKVIFIRNYVAVVRNRPIFVITLLSSAVIRPYDQR